MKLKKSIVLKIKPLSSDINIVIKSLHPDELINGKVDDQERLDFYHGYLTACQQAIEGGVKLKRYFAWPFMDDFEWASEYDKRFGLHFFDFKTLERIPKK